MFSRYFRSRAYKIAFFTIGYGLLALLILLYHFSDEMKATDKQHLLGWIVVLGVYLFFEILTNILDVLFKISDQLASKNANEQNKTDGPVWGNGVVTSAPAPSHATYDDSFPERKEREVVKSAPALSQTAYYDDLSEKEVVKSAPAPSTVAYYDHLPEKEQENAVKMHIEKALDEKKLPDSVLYIYGLYNKYVYGYYPKSETIEELNKVIEACTYTNFEGISGIMIRVAYERLSKF